ncbi:beta strand repeat-containing protein [Eubacterium limosum]|jgi:hypothetical protein|uniref:Uncharacterized protein n=1 Tax=Eubacterium limosum TaxID=1736 RepID=A0AAC9W3R5_EUBLI|nr:hypothetical protein [Eubacterium limosum]ARD66536.1 hypothetical protein B2M23_13775 [Eubacterium limosum]PWW49688.1 hypothetical protein C7955_11110 [Eubacterium limosum]UQZ22450.1 hypothetical protein M5595_19905 [Eubacterium limosum]
MKAKLKDKRLLLTAVFFCALAAVFLWPAGVKAATAGEFTVTGGTLGTDYTYSGSVLTVKTSTPLTISNTDPATATGNRIVAAGNATITLDSVNIEADTPLAIQNDVAVSLMLAGDNILASRSGAGLNVPGSAAVTIDSTDNAGSLTATGGGYAAGIGGNYQQGSGTITINGGTVTATGASYGAGIGGGSNKDDGPLVGSGPVNINGGNVTANSGGAGGAGIGGGFRGYGGRITITGGTVIANGKGGGAGIGGGKYKNSGRPEEGAGGTVIITGGSVHATADSQWAQNIGHGSGSSNSGSLTNGSDNVYLKTFTLKDSSGSPVTDAAIDAFTISHGIKDVRTDIEGKLYFYLPDSITDNTPVTVTAGGTDYVGKVSGSATLNPFAGDIDLSQGGNLYIWNDGYMRGNSADTSAKKSYAGNYTLSGGTAESPTANIVNVMGDYNGNPVSGTKKTITLNGVNIDVSSQSYACAFSIQAGTGAGTGANVNLMLSGSNTLKSGDWSAGLNATQNTDVSIDSADDAGSLTVYGGRPGTGIYADTLTVKNGNVSANAVLTSAGIQIGSTFKLEGGTVKATGERDSGIKGGTVNVSGGTLTAEGGTEKAGINSSNVNISGGSVTANGGSYGAGIGGNIREAGKNVTISGGTVVAKGGDYAADIGGGREGNGGNVIITGGSIKASSIGAGWRGSGGTQTDGSGNIVYLNTLTVGESAVSDGTAITSTDSADPNTLTNGYGVKDVVTMDVGKLYFYLPATTEASNPPIELKAGTDSTVYSRNYIRTWGSTATLLPPPTYTITIPEKVDFDSPTYQPAGSGQYNDKTFEVIPTTLTNLTDGRGLSVMVKDGGTSPSTGTDYQLTGSDSSDTLNYQVYQGASATGSALDAAGATLVNKWEKAAGGSLPSAQSGTLRLDQTQIKYSGSYTGTLTFTVNVVDSK